MSNSDYDTYDDIFCSHSKSTFVVKFKDILRQKLTFFHNFKKKNFSQHSLLEKISLVVLINPWYAIIPLELNSRKRTLIKST